jgi:hypothetical protein
MAWKKCIMDEGAGSLVLKTGEPEPAGFTGLMVDQFKPANKPNRSASLVPVIAQFVARSKG